jgi:hypothetical protein
VVPPPELPASPPWPRQERASGRGAINVLVNGSGIAFQDPVPMYSMAFPESGNSSLREAKPIRSPTFSPPLSSPAGIGSHTTERLSPTTSFQPADGVGADVGCRRPAGAKLPPSIFDTPSGR